MEQQKTKADYLKKIGRITLKVILGIFLFVLLLFLLLLTPPVQRFAVSKAEAFLEKKLGTRVEIGGVSIGLPRRVALNNIYIEDKTGDTLLYGGGIKADIALLKLLSGEVIVKEVRLADITAKIKRVLPDTAFNFQFIIDAFAPAQPAPVDTTSAPMKMDVDDVYLDNFRAVYKDVLTGNDMDLRIGSFAAGIDSLDLNTQLYKIGTVDLKNVVAVLKQTKPLATPEPPAKDAADAAEPISMNLGFERVNLDNIKIDYANDVSALYTNLNLDALELDGKHLDLQNQIIHFDKLRIDNTATAIRLSKKEAAKVVAKEAAQEVQAQASKAWTIKLDAIEINNNKFAFDNDNNPQQAYGIDYSHMKADSFTLHAEDFVMNTDSIGAMITEGHFKEKSGFQLDALKANLLYASNQAYIKDLYLKTPGTELKRNVVLEYASQDALVNQFPKTLMVIDIENSYVQVKDILAFAPQLRSQPAFRNSADVWLLNIQGSGNMDRLQLDALQVSGLSNTQLDASGTLASLTDPNQAGGTFTIRKFHTTQRDIALFTGSRLSTAQINLPESFDLTGTINGNAANLAANLNLYSSAGIVALNGRFANLTSPAKARYNTTVKATALQLGNILKNPSMGSLNAVVTANGSGFTPNAINTKFRGTIHDVGYNNYTYRNIKLDGSLRKTVFDVNADVADPNLDLTAAVNGNFSETPSFAIDAMIDSVKALPLHFTTTPLTFRGKIVGAIANADPNNLKADVLLTNSLLATADQRFQLDTVQVVADRTDSGQFVRLNSPIANAVLEGQYQLTELGTIFQQNINPYYTIATGPLPAVKPYDIRFQIDVSNSPLLTSFIPGFVVTEPIHVQGSLVTGHGLQGRITSKQLTFSGNQIQDLNAQINTTPQGLQFTAAIARLQSPSANMYNTRINATALNNNINFNVGIDDKGGKAKYYLAGLFSQPETGTYALQLQPDSLLLNYDSWTVAADNRLLLAPTFINANNFTLKKGAQRLSIQSAGAGNQPLNVSFAGFRLATITAFVQSDSLLVDGTLNGGATFRDVMKQPLFTSDLTISDLSLKQDTVGNINLKVSNTSMERYVADVTLTGKGNDVQITGPLVLQDKDVLLDLNVAVRSLKLKSMEGALATFVKEASGTITGNIDVQGTTTQPKLNGDLNFDSASVITTVLGGPLSLADEKLSITEEGFRFDDFSIRDSANNALTINGAVSTSNFINYKFGLDVDAKNFRAINTTQKENKLFFGELFLSTNLHIAGTEAAPIVDGTLTINDETRLSIVLPQAEPGVVERQGIVEFVNFDAPENDSLFVAYDSLNEVANPMAFDITANINISKQAVFNIIVDAANGDYLNIRGGGQLSAGIDPSGKISLTGDYEIEEGAYRLSFNFLQRRFDIQKGSKITWLGEPTSAQVAVTAVYIANTAPLDLMQNTGSEGADAAQQTQLLQKLPFQILLKIGGQLLKPEITFDIVLPADRNYIVGSDVISAVNARLIQLRQEPSELNKQVFAVLLLNRFVGENPFASSGGGGFNAGAMARQSVSKLLTEQLNSLAGDLIQGVDLNFDVASSEDYTTGVRRDRTDLNVGLSKRLLNDRLTVTVGSNFELEGPQQSNQRSNNIAGNVAVNYQLSKDGRYMLRFYRKNDYETNVEGYVIETGLGFIMTVDYNRIREILQPKKVRQERELRRKEREQQQPTKQIQEP
jgi:translocation and assembly module TamB